MKSYNRLFEKIASVENIERAIDRAAKGKRYKRSVRYALEKCHQVAERLHEELTNQTWRPPDIHIGREINDGIRMKKRVIVCPEFIREQVVHHALLQVIAPIFMQSFYKWSCGSVPGRGQESMAVYVARKVKKSKRKLYCANLDVGKCFESFDTRAIYELVSRKIRCEKTNWLMKLILKSNKVKQPDGSIKSGGLPIGLFTSPWFANIGLNEIDHYFKDEKGIYLVVRFMDDIMLMHQNRRELKKAIEGAGKILKKLGVDWKRKPEIHKFDHKVRMCGFYVYPEGKIELHDRVYLRGRRTGSRIVRKLERHKRVTSYDAERVNSYAARFKSFGCYRAFVKEVIKEGRIKMADMRLKISKKAKAQNRKAKNEQVQKDRMEQPAGRG